MCYIYNPFVLVIKLQGTLSIGSVRGSIEVAIRNGKPMEFLELA